MKSFLPIFTNYLNTAEQKGIKVFKIEFKFWNLTPHHIYENRDQRFFKVLN